MIARLPRFTLALAVSALLLPACGGDGDGRDGGEARRGGSITIGQTAQPDFLDPALSYTVEGWEPMWLVYTPLLTYESIYNLSLTHEQLKGQATLLTARLSNPKGYGRIIRGALGEVQRIVEESVASQKELGINEVNSGAYVFEVESLHGDFFGEPFGQCRLCGNGAECPL